MNMITMLLAAFSTMGCAGHLVQATVTAHGGHVPHAHHVKSHHNHVNRGFAGRWGRIARDRHGRSVQKFFVLGHDGHWKAGHRNRHGVHVSGRGRWVVRGGVLFLDHGRGFRRHARIHASSHVLRLSFANGHHQAWRRH